MARIFRIVSGFERSVILAMAGIVAVVFLVMEAQSERLEMTLAVRYMRSGLQWSISEHLMRGRDNQMGELVGANPIDFIGRGGEVRKLSSRWSFDGRHRELVYRPRMSLAFGGSDQLRWRVVGITGPDARVMGVRLVEVPPREE